MLTFFNGYCSILSGLPFIPYLDNLPNFNRSVDGPIRLPIVDKYKVPQILKLLDFRGVEIIMFCCKLGKKYLNVYYLLSVCL